MEFRLIQIFVLLAAAISIASCKETVSDSCQKEIRKLVWIEGADPIANAKEAIQAGELRYLAVYGFAVSIPGISEAESLKAYSEKNYVAIDGTGDDICSDEHYRLNNLAYKYAQDYNKILLSR